MAYAEKYYISYCDDFGTSRRVSILKKDYEGSSVELLADVIPITIDYESTEDFKFSPIRASKASVNMIFNSEIGVDFEEFWIADEKEFKIEDKKNGLVEWSGYVIANGFQYELKGGLYYANLEASDGLSSLESILFVDDNQKPYGNQNLVYNNNFVFPFSLIVTEILRKLDLDLDLWTCVDNYERTMLKIGDVREADPLSASFVNVKTYIKEGENEKIPYWYGSGEEWNCKEVLENILHLFGAKIYQEEGVWRLKTINSDIDYGSGSTQRYWRKYNTLGTYLYNYDIINDEVFISCNSSEAYLVDNDHVMYMDDVYKAFRMNYEYTFLRDGDNTVNLLPNGSFCDFNNSSRLAAPNGWYRWEQYGDRWIIRLEDIDIPFEDAGGNTCGIQIGTQKALISNSFTDPNPVPWSSLKTTTPVFIEKSSKINFEAWCKYKYYSNDSSGQYAPIFRCIFLGMSGKKYYLRNNIQDGIDKLVWEDSGITQIIRSTSGNIISSGINLNTDGCYFFNLNAYSAKKGGGRDTFDSYIWRYFNETVDSPPEDGWIDFHVHGLADTFSSINNSFPSFKTWSLGGTIRRGALLVSEYVLSDKWRIPRNVWEGEGGSVKRLQLTGLKLGVIRNESDLPSQQDYVYENNNSRYTLQVDPITVYNGDLQDENHLSNIIVPTNTSGQKNFWDDLSDSYGTSSLGLLTVREIMRQYYTPSRVLEGTIKIQDARFGSVYTFAAVPGIRFLLQRGSFNKQKQYIEDATFVQISSAELPNGGSEGGNSLEASWQDTGNVYCKTVGGINDGYVVIEQMDVNPNSETYQDTRETISDSQDLTKCPIGQPRLYYWGSDDVSLDNDNLIFYTFSSINAKEIQVPMFNDDGKYLYFVHLKSIGNVEKITTLTSVNNVLIDWVYLADITIDGYLYRVLRTDYVMTEFNEFNHNFKFS